jgi:hypothetical protein
MKIAQFRCPSGVTIILEEKVVSNGGASEHVRVSEWVDVEFSPRQPATAEELAALDAEERHARHALKRIDEKRKALQEVAA